jgi:hypothetical protein
MMIAPRIDSDGEHGGLGGTKVADRRMLLPLAVVLIVPMCLLDGWSFQPF